MSNKSYFDEPEDGESKFARKARESPFMVVGMVGFIAAAAIGAYKYKHRGTMSTSVFLMQLRVAAQGTVVGCLTAGLAYTMFNQYVIKNPKEDNKLSNSN